MVSPRVERVRRDPELHPVQPDEASRVPMAGAARAGAGEAAVPVLLGAVHPGALAHNHSAGLWVVSPNIQFFYQAKVLDFLVNQSSLKGKNCPLNQKKMIILQLASSLHCQNCVSAVIFLFEKLGLSSAWVNRVRPAPPSHVYRVPQPGRGDPVGRQVSHWPVYIIDWRTQFVASHLWNDGLILGFLLPMSQLSLMRAMSLVSFFESFFLNTGLKID